MDAAGNKDVVRRIYEEVVNGQRLDLVEDYFSPEYNGSGSPTGHDRGACVIASAATPTGPRHGQVR
jgi:hypothetical protein